MPNWLLEILDPLPLATAAMYFSLFFLVVAWTGVIFVRPFFRLWLRSQARLNEVVTAASAGFYLFYGLLLGLLSVAAYSNSRDISGFAGREAAELVSIYRSTVSYPEGVREEVRHLLRDYTVYVVDREWPSYQEGRVPLGGYNRLQAIRETLLAFEPQTRTQEITHTAVLRAFNDMVTLRQQRLAGVDASIPAALWYTVAIGGLITVVFLLLLDMRLGLHLFTTGMITTFLGLMVFIIYAQDRPLRNEIGASSAPFVAAYEMVMRWDDTP